MDQANSVVCVCETYEQAQRALYNLQGTGIDMGIVSIATRDISSKLHDIDFYNVGDETFTIPSIGSLLVSGPLASWIVATLDKGEGGRGVSIVGAALATLGIPRVSILQYEADLRTDKYVLVVHGSPDAVAKASRVIGGTMHCSHTVHGEKVFDTVHRASLLAEPA